MSNFKLHFSRQVRDYVAALPPDTKKRFHRELKNLSEGGGDTHPLVENLSGYWRLRIGRHRVIYFYGAGMVIECVYAGERATIYQTFAPPRIK